MAFPKQRRDIDIWIDEQIREAVIDFDGQFYNAANGGIQHRELVQYTLRISHLIGHHDQAGIGV